MSHIPGNYKGKVTGIYTGEVKAQRVVQIQVQLESGESAEKMYFVDSDRIDKAGKSQFDRWQDDMRLLGWTDGEDVQVIIGRDCAVKTDEYNGYAKVVFFNDPTRTRAPKWGDNNWGAIMNRMKPSTVMAKPRRKEAWEE
jgi:hypothetical protein